jgi:hypothetical protein
MLHALAALWVETSREDPVGQTTIVVCGGAGIHSRADRLRDESPSSSLLQA